MMLDMVWLVFSSVDLLKNASFKSVAKGPKDGPTAGPSHRDGVTRCKYTVVIDLWLYFVFAS